MCPIQLDRMNHTYNLQLDVIEIINYDWLHRSYRCDSLPITIMTTPHLPLQFLLAPARSIDAPILRAPDVARAPGLDRAIIIPFRDASDTLLLTLQRDRHSKVIVREDGLERCSLFRYGRCRLVVTYQLGTGKSLVPGSCQGTTQWWSGGSQPTMMSPETRWPTSTQRLQREQSQTARWQTGSGGRPACPIWRECLQRSGRVQLPSGSQSAWERSSAQAPSESTQVHHQQVLPASIRPCGDRALPEGQDPQDRRRPVLVVWGEKATDTPLSFHGVQGLDSAN